ncbi:hypothetical protein KW805_02215 [Candidatus Pacearchaeota archaeon]|nr:hypothetical protein [Candidatus Pacearchaeota archaeon]
MKKRVLYGLIIGVVVIVCIVYAVSRKGGSSSNIGTGSEPKCGTVNISFGSELITDKGKSKSIICLSNSVKDCTVSRSTIIGNKSTETLEGIFSVADSGAKCRLTYELSDGDIACDYTKAQLKAAYDATAQKIGAQNATYVYGLSIAIGMSLQVRIAQFAQAFQQQEAPAMQSLNMTFTNPATGKTEQIPCTFTKK